MELFRKGLEAQLFHSAKFRGSDENETRSGGTKGQTENARNLRGLLIAIIQNKINESSTADSVRGQSTCVLKYESRRGPIQNTKSKHIH